MTESGFPMDRFTFCGFLPAKGCDAALRADNRIRHTLVYRIRPRQTADALAAMARIMPERRVAVMGAGGKSVIGYPCELPGLNESDNEIMLVAEPAPEQKISDSEISEIVREVIKGANNG